MISDVVVVVDDDDDDPVGRLVCGRFLGRWHGERVYVCVIYAER